MLLRVIATMYLVKVAVNMVDVRVSDTYKVRSLLWYLCVCKGYIIPRVMNHTKWKGSVYSATSIFWASETSHFTIAVIYVKSYLEIPPCLNYIHFLLL